MTRVLPRLLARVGRRGSALLTFAFIDFVLAWSLVDGQSRQLVQAAAGYRALLGVASLTVWAWVWGGVGALCAVQAFCRRDQWAYAAAIAVKVVWGGGLAVGWVLYDAPRAWVSAATWGVLAALVLVLSGWPEPGKRP